jgi:hypothetical protein
MFWVFWILSTVLFLAKSSAIVADPGSGTGTFRSLDPGSEWVKNQDPGSGFGMNGVSYFRELKKTIFWDKIPYLNSLWIWDPGWRKFGFGIRDGKKSDPG